MIDTQHIHPEDLALHAMQLLSSSEYETVQAHIEHCAECRNEFHAAQNDLSITALSVDLATPAPQTRDRFLKQIAKEKRVIPIDRAPAVTPIHAVTAKPATGGKVLPWLGWAVAAGVTLAAGNMYRERGQLQTTVADQSAELKNETAQMATMSSDAVKARKILDALTSSSSMRVTLNATPAAKALPQGHAAYLSDKGMLVFMADHLAPLPNGKVYELWVLPASGAAPIPAGTFQPDARGNANVIQPPLPAGITAKAFAVTIENEGGATTPTMPIVLVGA